MYVCTNIYTKKITWALKQKIKYCNHRASSKWSCSVEWILSYFSETIDQNCKSCSPSMYRRENFDFQQHLGPKSYPAPQRTEELGHNWNSNTGTLSEAEGPLSRKIQCWRSLTTNGQSPRSFNQSLPSKHLCISGPHDPLQKPTLNPGSGGSGFWTLASCTLGWHHL